MNKEVGSTRTSVVLLYHRLGFPKLSSLVAGQYVAPVLFNSQLNYLFVCGWQCESLSDILVDNKPQQDRFCVTFDDGYLSVYEHAYPALAARNMTATVYVVADSVGGINAWDRKAGDYEEPMMSAAQVREMSEAGFEIGSHTLTHPHLTDLDDNQLKQEIIDSKHKLEDIVGKEVVSFSYPYGDCDSRVISAVMDAGYKNAVSTKLGLVYNSSEFEVPRVNVRWNAVTPLLMRKIRRARQASGLSK